MKNQIKNISFIQRATALVFLWWLLLFVGNSLGIGILIEAGIKRPLEIRFREWDFRGKQADLDQNFKLDSRIKIIAFDDRTMSLVRRPDLSTGEWAVFLKTLVELKPKVILLDFLFSIPTETDGINQLKKILENSSVPIYSAVQVRKDEIPGRLDLASFLEEKGMSGKLHYSKNPFNVGGMETWGHVYGPTTDIAESMPGFGHIIYNGNGTVNLALPLHSGKLVNHIALNAASQVEYTSHGAYIDGEFVKIGNNLETQVNFRSQKYYHNGDSELQMGAFLKSIKEGRPINVIKENDVIIIAKTFTGSTDFVQTPAGYMPGVYVLASVVDSVLTGRWLSKFGYVTLVTLVFAVLGGALALLLPSVGFLMGLIVVAAGIVLAGLISFSMSNVLLPWDMSLLAFLGGAFSVFGEKARMIENRSKQLRFRLTRFIPSTRLSEMIKKPETMVWDPCGKVVSIMFVDMINFSATVEKQSVNDVFLDLREMINAIIEAIHHHGGIVQKTLGDGVLAHFGYDYDGEKTRREHTDRIVACAIDIQRKSLELNSMRVANSKFVYPLRVGIHTSNVFLGNIGDDLLPDITMVGHGVNFAKRMESTCEPFRIMLSATTYECINAELFKDCEFSTRQIHVKHFDKPVTATEINPIVGKEIQQKRIEQHFRECLGIERNEMRWPLGDSVPISVSSPQTAGKIIDYSRSGFLIQLDKYYGKGVKLTLTLHSIDEAINKELEKNGFSQIVVEVRWGSIVKDEFIHGVMISSLTDRQKNTFENILKERLSKTDYFADAS